MSNVNLIASQDDKVVDSLYLSNFTKEDIESIHSFDTDLVKIETNDIREWIKKLYDVHLKKERPYRKANITAKSRLFHTALDIFDFSFNTGKTFEEVIDPVCQHTQYERKMISTIERYAYVSDCVFIQDILSFIERNKEHALYICDLCEFE